MSVVVASTFSPFGHEKAPPGLGGAQICNLRVAALSLVSAPGLRSNMLRLCRRRADSQVCRYWRSRRIVVRPQTLRHSTVCSTNCDAHHVARRKARKLARRTRCRASCSSRRWSSYFGSRIPSGLIPQQYRNTARCTQRGPNTSNTIGPVRTMKRTSIRCQSTASNIHHCGF